MTYEKCAKINHLELAPVHDAPYRLSSIVHNSFFMNRLRSFWLWKSAASHLKKTGAMAADVLARWHPYAKPRVDLKTPASRLKQVGSQLEQEFLATGVALEKLANQSMDVVTKSDKFVGFATGRSEGATIFFDAMPVVEKPMKFLNDSHPKTEQILKRLRQDCQRIDELINVQVELQRTIGPLKYIQTLFKIESAPLGGEVQAMFGSLTKEIETLHDQVCELFTTRFQELRAIQRTVNQVINELQTQTDNLWTSITKEKAHIEKSLQQLQEELAANQSRESHISQLSKQINQEIQQIVMGLQYQDIINQKIEHTLAALVRLETHLASDNKNNPVVQSCRLEAGQLQAARQELANAEKSVRNGITRTLDCLVSADNECLTLADFKQLTTSADGMVQVLFDALATLRKQITATVESSARAYEQLRPIGGLASDLTHVVRDLSVRIHLIGLNAQLQAAQVAEGAGLEVLSARTSEISRATTHISEQVAQKLDRLVLDLADDAKVLEQLHSEAADQQNTLAQNGSQIEQDLHKLRDGTLGLLNDINTLLEDIRTESQKLLSNVNYVEVADGALKELEDTLLNIASSAVSRGQTASSQSEALVELARNEYSMHSERKVFAKVLGGHINDIHHPEENLVELFDAPGFNPSAPQRIISESEIKSPAPVASPKPAPLKELAKSETKTTLNGSTSPVNLGDNVELF